MPRSRSLASAFGAPGPCADGCAPDKNSVDPGMPSAGFEVRVCYACRNQQRSKSMKYLEGKVVLVSGGSTGIGAAAARAFAAHGARTMVHYNASKEAAEALVSGISAAGGEAHLIGGDVTELSN